MRWGSYFQNRHLDGEIKSWVGFPGELYLRALKCLVIPMIFLNMISGVAEISKAGGNVGKVGGITIKMYLITTFIAALEGLCSSGIFSQIFSCY